MEEFTEVYTDLTNGTKTLKKKNMKIKKKIRKIKKINNCKIEKNYEKNYEKNSC